MPTPIKPKQAALTLLNETIIALEGEEPSTLGTELLCTLLEARDMLTKKIWVGKKASFAPDAEYEAWLEKRSFEQRERGLR